MLPKCGRQQLAPDGVAAFAVEYFARLQVALGGGHHVSVPAGGHAGGLAAQRDAGHRDADFEAETDYIKNCFEEYNAHTDPSGRYFTLYKRWHLIGLEVGMSVASVALRGEPTGVATGWNADVVATASVT